MKTKYGNDIIEFIFVSLFAKNMYYKRRPNHILEVPINCYSYIDDIIYCYMGHGNWRNMTKRNRYLTIYIDDKWNINNGLASTLLKNLDERGYIYERIYPNVSVFETLRQQYPGFYLYEYELTNYMNIK